MPPAVVALVRTNAALAIHQRIEIITNAPITPTEKVQALLLMLPAEGRENQRRLAHGVMRWADDPSFRAVRPVMLDPSWHPQIHSVFMTGLLKRKNHLRLPMLLELAQAPGHPSRAEARQLLEHFLGIDHGNDWQAWRKSLAAWLQRHPD